MRTLSSNARAALYAAQTAEVFLQLLTIEHDDLVAPIRLVDNTEAIVSAGETFDPFPFRIVLPAETDTELPTVELVVDNVSRELLEEVRSISTPFTVTLEIVLASDPDTVEAGPFLFESRSASYDVQTLRFELGAETFMTEPFPADIYTPTTYPGLFEGVDR